MNRTICATDWEVEALLAGATMLWRPVKPPPRENAELVCLDGLKRHKWTDSFYFIKACPYGQPGDMLAVKECWRPWYRTGGRCTYGAEGILYRADESSVEMRLPLGCWQFRRARDWRSPATMPRWAVRPGFIRPITGVQCKQVQAISIEEVIAAGVSGDSAELGGFDEGMAFFRFIQTWDSRYRNTPYAWSENPPAWGFTLGGSDDH